ncbi:dephospho-CoA kinase [Ornithinimicrobium sp. W1679]|uniref:dephospho-CoA kinase n=1 Tax=Ornithinimicrobium sp. W1679 TaxID=3418770 RepID=UPI003CF137C8
MLWVGLSGGIGSGKSTVSARLAEHGAVVVDADRVAREVVTPGMPALAAIVDRFGPQVLGPDGALDRGVLGQVVFADDGARRDLEAITHPRIAARTRELVAAAPDDAVVVHDIPLLVELDRAAGYALTVIVDVPAEERLRRLVQLRGMDPEQARARIEAQVSDEERAAAADVLLDNSGTIEQLHAAVDRLWDRRLVPFAENLRRGWSSWEGSTEAGEPVEPVEDGRCRTRAERSLRRIAEALQPEHRSGLVGSGADGRGDRRGDRRADGRGEDVPGTGAAPGEVTALRCDVSGGGRCELRLSVPGPAVLEDAAVLRRLGRVGFVVDHGIVLGADPQWQVRCRVVEDRRTLARSSYGE